MSRPLTIVGAGRLARAVVAGLAVERRADVVVAARRVARARALVRGLPHARAADLDDAIAGAAAVLLAVSDREIAPLARSLARRRGSWRGVAVLHAAGAYGPELLAPLRRKGAATGVWHPLAVAGSGEAPLLGARARIEGDPAARALARHLCAVMGMKPLAGKRLASPSGRAAYHAAASLASNDVVALLSAAIERLVARGVARGEATEALGRLAAGTIEQLQAAGPEGALTGPVARGDAPTLAAQLRTLRAVDRPAHAAHRALSAALLRLAVASGRLDRRASRDIARLLRGGPGGHPGV